MDTKLSKSVEELNEIASNANKQTVNDLNYVDPRLIVVDLEHNVRNFDDPRVQEHIVELTENIRENGVMTPLECRRGEKLEKPFIDPKTGKEYPLYQWIVVDGQCRLTAVMRLIEQGINIKTVPVMNVRQNSNICNYVLDMLNANVGLRFSPIELAKAYQRLKNYHYTEADIAKAVGKSPNHVHECLDLLSYTPDIQHAMKIGKITANNVRQVAKSWKDEGNTESRNDFVAKKLKEATDRAMLSGQEEGKIGKFIEINKTEVKKTDVDVLAEHLDAVLNALPKRDSYTREQLEELFDMLSAGHPIRNSINCVFGTKVADGTNG